MSEVIAQVAAPKYAPRIAVISGPSFAVEAARGEPTAIVVASRDAALAAELQEEFACPNFRLYTNEDVLGVELAGAMKWRVWRWHWERGRKRSAVWRDWAIWFSRARGRSAAIGLWGSNLAKGVL
jgi:hypothetical protein